MNTLVNMCGTFACQYTYNVQLDDFRFATYANIALRHFRPPGRHLLLNTHDTNMEFLQLNGPLLDIFLFLSKTKIFHSHPWICLNVYVLVNTVWFV